MKKVLIYGTLGPACRDIEMLIRMFDEGMDGIRLNLSHTTLDDAADLIDTYFKAAESCRIRPELLIDMQGPELRIGVLEKPVTLREGEMISADEIPFPEAVLQLISQRKNGQEILLDDGKIMLKTENVQQAHDGDECRLRVFRGGRLESRKSVALPGCHIDTPAMTETDRENIRKAKQYGVTAVMQPFVRSREDLIEVRQAMKESGCEDIKILAKIENLDGVARLEELIPHCDEIVIARGDLGNALDLWELPAVQKRIAEVCRKKGRDFMVVTQMLDSMTHKQVPTRAEVSDIFNAVLDGASSVMVTGETAAGDYPDLAIRYLSKTVHEAESYLDK